MKTLIGKQYNARIKAGEWLGTFSTKGGAFDTLLGAYPGSDVTSLTFVAANGL